ncbi:hypothetical protein F2Q70_00030423 [Brassica cretica]|uniref:Uncharacterized protein n=1 Tax=Brassica cretica TaxID=69181 RepID=A0A8S9FKW2_BRACR|nr:hypothetical protein F2Q70_00030423 [Brassica cretica]
MHRTFRKQLISVELIRVSTLHYHVNMSSKNLIDVAKLNNQLYVGNRVWIKIQNLKTLSDPNIETPVLSSSSDAGGALARRRPPLLPPLMLPLSLSYMFGSSSLVLDPSHPGRASVTAMVSSRRGKLAGTVRSISDSWDALQLTTLHRRVSLTKSRICSSPPWYLGYAPTQPDPPQSPACFLPRVSVVTTTWSNPIAAATNNTSTQTSSRRPLGVKD